MRQDLERLYRTSVPASIRNPIGMSRRRLQDALRRAFTRPGYPPRELLDRVQTTSLLDEYIEVGKASARTVLDALSAHLRSGAAVLDFGCGSGRTLRYLRSSGWALHGCDVDAPAVHWCERNLRFAQYAVTPEVPPTQYPSGTFDGIFSISVFTHLSFEGQRSWAAEMARLLRTDGKLLVTTMGEWVLTGIAELATEERVATLRREGVVFAPQPGGFNRSGAFHTREGIERVFAPWFRLDSFTPRGLKQFQDVAVLTRTGAGAGRV